jgi:hypothetical protein
VPLLLLLTGLPLLQDTPTISKTIPNISIATTNNDRLVLKKIPSCKNDYYKIQHIIVFLFSPTTLFFIFKPVALTPTFDNK